MPTTTVTITGNVHDMIAGDFDTRRTKVYLRHNTAYIVDPDEGLIRLGSATIAINADGTFSLPDVIASVDTVENLQATVYVDYADPSTRTRVQQPFGPYDLTAESGTVDLTELEQTQHLDPSFASETMDAMQALLDEMETISGLTGEDEAVAYLIENPSDTQDALAASTAEAMRRPTQPLVGSQLIVDSLASAALTGHTVGTPVTGLSEPDTAAALTAFNTLTGGSYVTADITRTEPNYAYPRKDPIYRISGPFKYLFDSTSQHVGTWIAGRTDAGPTGGSTGNQGQVSWTLPAGSRYFLMRYRAVGAGSTVMKVRFWASKDGGTPKPFRLLSSQDGNEQLTLSADGLYCLLPVDLGATGTWTITADIATGTFGGLYTLTTLLPTSPAIRSGRALVIADSFGTPGQGQFATSLGYVMQVVRSLGLEAHVSATGGTGVVARDSGGTTYNYLERVNQVGGDVDGFFDDYDQPAYIAVQLSQNDETYGYAGTSSFDTNFAALMRALRGRFPDVPFDVYGIMHTRSETGAASGGRPYASKNAAYFALEDQAIAFLDANPDLNIGYVPGLLRAGIATGTGYQGATTGTGTSDTATWTDGSHASPINGTAPTGHGQIATQVLAVTTALRPQILQPDGGYKRPLKLTSTIGTAYADQAAGGNHAHTDAISVSRLPAVWAPYRQVWAPAKMEVLTGLLTGTDYIFAPGVGVVTAATAGSGAGLFQIDDDQQAISGLTTKMRLRVECFGNETSAACTATATLMLAGALSGAGLPSVAIGSAASPAMAATTATLGANGKNVASSGPVTAPSTNTFYLVKITLSADMAASSQVYMRVALEATNA